MRPRPDEAAGLRSPWSRRYVTHPAPAFRLFCFPYAGAGASIFRDWRLPAELAAEVVAIQLPGRENRIVEAPLRRLDDVVRSLAAELAPLLDRPFAFFGHSMGALIAFEFTRHLRRTGAAMPLRLFLSAYRAPQLPGRSETMHLLPESRLLSRLDEMAGGSVTTVREPELTRLLAPVIRADFELCETFPHRAEPALDVPLTCFGATDDPEVRLEEITAWEVHSTRRYRLRRHRGGHLFLRDHADRILGQIAEDLAMDGVAGERRS